MEGLTIRVNLSAPLAHPSDKEATGTTIKTLVRSAGAAVDASEVEAWAVANGWPLDAARELASMIRKIIDGGQVRAGRVDRDLLERWRARLAG